MAPAAALVTVGVTCTARWRGSTTPVTPAHSAERSERAEVARVGDAVDGDQERRRSPCRAGERVESASGSGAASARTPWRGLGAGARRRAGPGDVCDRHPARLGQLGEVGRDRRRRRTRWPSQDLADLAPPASSSSRTAWRPSTCSPPRPLAAADRRAAVVTSWPARGRPPRAFGAGADALPRRGDADTRRRCGTPASAFRPGLRRRCRRLASARPPPPSAPRPSAGRPAAAAHAGSLVLRRPGRPPSTPPLRPVPGRRGPRCALPFTVTGAPQAAAQPLLHLIAGTGASFGRRARPSSRR